MQADQDALLAYRPEFPILDKTTYLTSNSLGAMPKAAAFRASGSECRWLGRPAVVT